MNGDHFERCEQILINSSKSWMGWMMEDEVRRRDLCHEMCRKQRYENSLDFCCNNKNRAVENRRCVREL
jgi:hypothetical protein